MSNIPTRNIKWIRILLAAAVLSLIAIYLIWFFVLSDSKQTEKLSYPTTWRNESVVEEHFGKKVVDPYRWLEDPDSEQTKKFVVEQNKFSQPYLDQRPEWKKFNENLTKVWNYPKYTTPRKYGDYYYSFMNTGLQNQSIYYRQKTLTSEPEVFLDPNTFSTDGTIALGDVAFSPDGKLLGYGLSESGSDWVKIKIRDTNTGKDYSETLEHIKFGEISWTSDSRGFFYSRYPTSDDGSDTTAVLNQKIYYHRVNQNQEKDVLVAEFPEHPQALLQVKVSDCGRYVIVTVRKGSVHTLIYIVDLHETGDIVGKFKLNPIYEKFDAVYTYVTNTETKFIFRTNKNAPNSRVIIVDLNNPKEDNWITLVPENKEDPIRRVLAVHDDKLLIQYTSDVKAVLQIHSLANGTFIRKLPLEVGDVNDISGSRNKSEIFYTFQSFLVPGIIYKYDFAKPEEPTIFREIKLNLKGFDKNDFSIEQVFYPSRDGTKIPMYIVQRKQASNTEKKIKPCLLYGYGGFHVSLLPEFSIYFLTFINSFDGILAHANLRGGGEYGAKWHDAGRLLNKQNVFDDFQAAAKYLVDNKYTERSKLAIEGRSNGGLLVGACITQRPDLFGVAVANVGVLDMLRYHKFTIGYNWIPDYGNPDEEIHFNNLYKYSPLHNVWSPSNSSVQYPHTLILTGDHDDRVSPLHSLKFAAELHHAVRHSPHQSNPILLRVYSKAGHGSGKPIAMKIAEYADILTFMYGAFNLNLEL